MSTRTLKHSIKIRQTIYSTSRKKEKEKENRVSSALGLEDCGGGVKSRNIEGALAAEAEAIEEIQSKKDGKFGGGPKGAIGVGSDALEREG